MDTSCCPISIPCSGRNIPIQRERCRRWIYPVFGGFLFFKRSIGINTSFNIAYITECDTAGKDNRARSVRPGYLGGCPSKTGHFGQRRYRERGRTRKLSPVTSRPAYLSLSPCSNPSLPLFYPSPHLLLGVFYRQDLFLHKRHVSTSPGAPR